MNAARPRTALTVGGALCLTLLLVADLAIVFLGPWWFDTTIAIVLAIPLSQCSLAAILALQRFAASPFRYLLPPLGVIGCWYLATYVLPWGISDPASAAWALAFAVQSVVIVTTLLAVRSLKVRSADRRLRFELSSLLTVTAGIALVLGFLQFGSSRWQWDRGVAEWEHFWSAPVIGTVNAIVALQCVWAVAARSWLGGVLRLVAQLGLALGWGMAIPMMIEWLTGTRAIESQEGIGMTVTKAVIVYTSLLLLGSADLGTGRPTISRHS